MADQHFHPRERARATALEAHATLEAERAECHRKGIEFTRWDELAAAHTSAAKAHVGVANVVPCVRCYGPADLDDADTLTLHVTAGVRRVRLEEREGGLDQLEIYQPVNRDGLRVTPWGYIALLEPPKEGAIAFCPTCAPRTEAYVKEGPEAAAEMQDPPRPAGLDPKRLP